MEYNNKIKKAYYNLLKAILMPNKRVITHGMYGTRENNIWRYMLYRVRNKKFSNYGGRGITVCERWLKFENFYEDMGKCPEGMTLDRIDNNGNYCKENCRWVDNLTQQNNKRNNHFVEYNGERKTYAQWGREYNIDPKILRGRYIKSKWSFKDSLEKEVICR